MKVCKPFGSWPSKVSAEVLADKGRRFGHMALDRGTLYWLEVRASEQGRGVLMSASNGSDAKEVLPTNISVRTRVHEYGGGDFCVTQGQVYFSNAEDNQIYHFDGKLTQITESQGVDVRYADFALSLDNHSLVVVRETHKGETVTNDLIMIDLKTHKQKLLHSGFDFYSFPRFSPSGHRLCWTCWNQPDMPWESAELWMADVHQTASVGAAHLVSGGEGISIFQPEWSADGVIHYISDASNWSNLYSHRDGILNALTPVDRDFAVPQWVFGMGTYTLGAKDGIYALCWQDGRQQLQHIQPETGHIEPVALPFTHYTGPLLGDSDNLYFCAAGPQHAPAMYRFHIESSQYQQLTPEEDFILDNDEISEAQAIRFQSKNERVCHAFYYAPLNKDFCGPEDSAPPLIVMSHGGPTAATDDALSADIQFWTNRGFAVVDVNYAGSTGFGKRYRELLKGEWGVADVEDCIAAANFLVEKGLANADQLLIRGGSAGGYTTLCALTFHSVFAAGMSRYGVADLESLASDSHKFEARYLDKIVGPYPEDKKLYQERSPIHHTDKLSCPILLLQGEDDKVVPPNQAESMVAALEKKQIPYAYLLFSGEGHGFRQAQTIVQAFNAELFFYRRILGIESDENLPELDIRYQ